jgi:PIN domain nuclease of toxin-antitoxin system
MAQNILLDTQILIWLAQSPDLISVRANSSLISNNRLLFSHVSIWEMIIKIKIGKLKINEPLENFIAEAIKRYSIEVLPINVSHIYQIQKFRISSQRPI